MKASSSTVTFVNNGQGHVVRWMPYIFLNKTRQSIKILNIVSLSYVIILYTSCTASSSHGLTSHTVSCKPHHLCIVHFSSYQQKQNKENRCRPPNQRVSKPPCYHMRREDRSLECCMMPWVRKQRHSVQMPICSLTRSLIYGRPPPNAAVRQNHTTTLENVSSPYSRS